MKQNIYDDPRFYAGYAKLRETESGLNAALEVPALRSLLPDLHGKRILDLGCGFGGFASYALDAGADSYTGVDISEKMLAAARESVRSPRATFLRSAMEDLEIPPAAFDVAVSSLALHYVADIAPVFRAVADGLSPGGLFAFSVEHPMCTSLLSGWHRGPNGEKLHWPVDRYRDEGRRDSTWFVDGVIKYHRTVETYVNSVIDAGMRLTRLLEPPPLESFVRQRPDLADDRRRPPFLMIAAIRNSGT